MREISEQEWNALEKTLLALGNELPKEVAVPFRLMMTALFTGRRINDKINELVMCDVTTQMMDVLEHPKKWGKIAEYLQLVEHGLDAFVAQLADKEAPE